MTVLFPFRAEFGAILFYFYISDRTSLLGESKKVPPLNLFDEFPLSVSTGHQNFLTIYVLYMV